MGRPCVLQCDTLCRSFLSLSHLPHSFLFLPSPLLPVSRNLLLAPPSSHKPSSWKTAPSNLRSGTRRVKNVIAPLLPCTIGGRPRRLSCMTSPMPRALQVRRWEGGRKRRRGSTVGAGRTNAESFKGKKMGGGKEAKEGEYRRYRRCWSRCVFCPVCSSLFLLRLSIPIHLLTSPLSPPSPFSEINSKVPKAG